MFLAKEKVQMVEMKIQMIIILLSFCGTDDNTQYCYFHTLYYSKVLKKMIFPSAWNIQFFKTDNHFSRRN